MKEKNGIGLNRLVCFTLISSLVFPVSLHTAPEPNKIVLQEFQGDVRIIKAGEQKGEKPSKGAALNADDSVVVGKSGSAKIVVEETAEIDLEKESTWSYQVYELEKNRIRFSAHLS